MMTLEEAKDLIKHYDDGFLSPSDVETRIFRSAINSIISVCKDDGRIRTISSCCCRSHQPDEVYKVKIVKEAHGFNIGRLKWYNIL